MKQPSLLQISRRFKVADMAARVGCSEAEARAYLVAEEWVLSDALISYRGDRRAELQAERLAEWRADDREAAAMERGE